MDKLIAPQDRARVEALALRDENPVMRRAAQIVLLYDEGLPTREIARRVGLSRSRTRFWRRRFAALGVALFSGETLQGDGFISDTDEVVNLASEEFAPREP